MSFSATNWVRIASGPDGRPLATKHGPIDRLRHEATCLDAAAHPGVVTFNGLDADSQILSTGWVGGETLATAISAQRPRKWVALVTGRLATTVAALHDRGIVHGRIEPSHVVVGDDVPILLGFAEASLHGADTARDVAAIGQLVLSLLGPTTVPPRPRPTRLTRSGDARTVDPREGSLRSAALRANSSRIDSGCTAHELARVLLDIATDESTTAPAETRMPSSRRRSARVLMIAGVAIAATVAVVTLVGGSPSTSTSADQIDSVDVLPATESTATQPGPPTTSIPAAAPTTAPSSASAAAPTTATSPASAPTPASTTIALTPLSSSTATSTPAVSATTSFRPSDPQPVASNAALPTRIWPQSDCSEPCRRGQPLGDGIVIHDSLRYRIAGFSGDRIVLGDWDCDGSVTAALLRTPSGAIDVFDAWPTASAPAMARRVGVHADAIELDVEVRGTCDALIALDAAHARSELTTNSKGSRP
jgi:hypothetical protein